MRHAVQSARLSAGTPLPLAARGCYACPVRNPYEVLGVSPSASADEIKAAFRRLARENHPDHNQGDTGATERFKEINAAYQVLGDPSKRAQFDRMGDARQRQYARPGVSVEDWLADILGGFSRAQPVETGDLREVIELDFEEAALGTTRNVRYQRTDTCERCDGSGADANSRSTTCERCAGRGRVRVGAGFLFGAALEQPCSTCAATGRIFETPCAGCGGRGVAAKTRTIEVTLPPGIESGAAQTLIGGGSRPAPTLPVGDLELLIQVRPHPKFRREGDDVLVDLDVPFVLAALGGRIEVDSLHGPTEVRLAAGTQSGDSIVLRGKGIPHRFRSGAGDQLCAVRVRIPEQLSARAEQLVRQLRQELIAPEPEGVLVWLRAFVAWLVAVLRSCLPRVKHSKR